MITNVTVHTSFVNLNASENPVPFRPSSPLMSSTWNIGVKIDAVGQWYVLCLRLFQESDSSSAGLRFRNKTSRVKVQSTSETFDETRPPSSMSTYNWSLGGNNECHVMRVPHLMGSHLYNNNNGDTQLRDSYLRIYFCLSNTFDE